MEHLEHKKYPIGRFAFPEQITDADIDSYIETLKTFPAKIKHITARLNDDQLDTQYREGGWTVRQVIHHLADSHMQAFSRFKLALTEDNPVINPFDENKWAELQDCRRQPVDPSLEIISGLHKRWVHLLKTLTNAQFDRSFVHPGKGKTIKLKENLALYAWHSNHHYAHIENLVKEKGW